MAAKKKTKKNPTKAKKAAAKKTKPGKKTAKKRAASAKNPKKTVRRKVLMKAEAAPKKTITPKAATTRRQKQSEERIQHAVTPSSRRARSRGVGSDSAGQSGDLQGLSSRQRADSESVDELIEEGNAFEADAVSGVEEAGNAEGREVYTREVPEDDVPEEYLDKE